MLPAELRVLRGFDFLVLPVLPALLVSLFSLEGTGSVTP
jgi:hypothetical protein